MGRPKKSDLRCQYCDRIFNTKKCFEEHMESHSDNNNSKGARTHANWCDICKKGFEDSEYKSHIQTVHQYGLHDSSTSSSADNLFSFENGYIFLSKKRIKNEFDRNSSAESVESQKKVSSLQNTDLDISLTIIKSEPVEVSKEKCNESPKKKAKPKMPLIKCKKCDMRCKGLRGLKIHTAMIHKYKLRKTSSSSGSEVDDQKEKQLYQNKNKSLQENANNPILISNNVINLDSNIQPMLFQNVLQLNNTSSIVNQSNAQVLKTPAVQNIQIVEIIPKFNCNSESYVKWLKKFIHKCKTSKYPLPQVMCENMNYVLDEMSYALGNPIGPLRKKSNHFYFMKMHKILSDIIMGHMKHSLLVAVN